MWVSPQEGLNWATAPQTAIMETALSLQRYHAKHVWPRPVLSA